MTSKLELGPVGKSAMLSQAVGKPVIVLRTAEQNSVLLQILLWKVIN